MKRIKVNASWEEDEEERRRFFSSLSYSERLRHYFRLRDTVNFKRQPEQNVRIFKVYRSHAEANVSKLDKLKDKQ